MASQSRVVAGNDRVLAGILGVITFNVFMVAVAILSIMLAIPGRKKARRKETG